MICAVVDSYYGLKHRGKATKQLHKRDTWSVNSLYFAVAVSRAVLACSPSFWGRPLSCTLSATTLRCTTPKVSNISNEKTHSRNHL